MIYPLLHNLVKWIVYAGLEQEATRDNEWVVTLVSTLLVLFVFYQLSSWIIRIIKYCGKLWWK